MLSAMTKEKNLTVEGYEEKRIKLIFVLYLNKRQMEKYRKSVVIRERCVHEVREITKQTNLCNFLKRATDFFHSFNR